MGYEESEMTKTEIQRVDEKGQPIQAYTETTMTSSKVTEKKPRSWGKMIAILALAAILLAILIATLVYYNTLPARRELQWYHKTVVYQIYPRSFQDSDGDGTGDLKGITSRLDYLKQLGVTTLWLSPFYTSPMKDFGYDITNHKEVDKLFGTMADFDDLVTKAHNLDIKIILDYVPNHTSDQNAWFLESRKSRNNSWSDYFVWHDGVLNTTSNAREPPNNWMSVFGKPAWEWGAEREQFYYHAFLPSQPDLNWTNPRVVEEMDAVLKHWLDRKVDGFRIDAIPYLFEIPQEQMAGADELTRNPYEINSNLTAEDYDYYLHPYTMGRKETVEFPNHWTDMMRSYADANNQEPKLLVLEVVNKNISETIRYYPKDPFVTATMPFYFGLVLHLNGQSNGYDVERSVRTLLDNLPPGGWPSWVIGNHDQRRATGRLGSPELIDGLNMLNLLLPGTPTTYYGEEIGMRDIEITDFEQIKDPYALNYPDTAFSKTRDHERGPMQWDGTTNAGFTANVTHGPWLPLGPGWDSTINVEYQKANVANHTHYGVYRDLVRIRRTAAFQQGQMRVALVTPDLFSFIREYGDTQYLVAIDLRRNTTEDTNAYDFTNYYLKGDARIATASVNMYHNPKTNSLSKKTLTDNIDLSKVYLEPSAGIVLRVSYTH